MNFGEQLKSLDANRLVNEHNAWCSLSVEQQEKIVDIAELMNKYPALVDLAEVILAAYLTEGPRAHMKAPEAANLALSAFVITLVRYAESPDLK